MAGLGGNVPYSPDEGTPVQPFRVRTVFISDLHLGSVGAKPSKVRSFLHAVDTEYLYLVGDVFDGWVGTSPLKWDIECANVVRTVLGLGKRGTIVRYTPGNHDAVMRRLNGSELGNLAIDHSFVHALADGRELWIEHGDLFDKGCTKYRLFAYYAAWAYEMALHMNAGVNRARSRYHRRPVDFCTALKLTVKRVSHRKKGFADRLADHCAASGCDGIVCGHIHRPEIRQMTNGTLYVNTGDWVEHGSAVVEHLDGTLELVDWKQPSAVLEPGRFNTYAGAIIR
jgi:UDP-2,3-diacylglucosamine pyrophosphatase LpxH